VQKALETRLHFTKKRIAPVIHKVLTSALDNAKYLSDERVWIWMWTTCTSRPRLPTKARA
jgi:ribosomal protein L22